MSTFASEVASAPLGQDEWRARVNRRLRYVGHSTNGCFRAARYGPGGPLELQQACCVAGGEMSEEIYARYFADRETFERAMTRRAKNGRVAAVHAELADRYEALARVFGAKVAGPR